MRRRGRLPAALLPVVDDVVVQQRGQVDQLGRDRHVLRAPAGTLPEARRREQHGEGPDALSPASSRWVAESVPGEAPSRGHPRELGVDQRHILAQQRVHLLDALAPRAPLPARRWRLREGARRMRQGFVVAFKMI